MKKWIVRILIWLVLGVVVYVVSAVIRFVTDYDGPRMNTPFEEAHEKAMKSFVDGAGFGIGRMKRLEHWNEISVRLGRDTYEMESIQLIGSTKEDGPRYYTEFRLPPKKPFSEAENRKLTPQEQEALSILRKRREPYYREGVEESFRVYNEDTRVIAPLFARKSCLKCHEAEVGDLLGAFDYRLKLQED